MADKTIELNRRRVLGGMITIGGAAAAAGAGTFAYFSDTQTSTDNDIVAGTITLNGAADAQFTASNLAPGETVGPSSIQATYDSGSSIDPAELDFSTAISEPSSLEDNSETIDVTAADLAGQLNLDTATLSVNGTVQTDFIADLGFTTLADFDGYSQDSAASGAGGLSPGDTVTFEIQVTMDSATGNSYQGDAVSLDVTFTAEQPGAD